MVGVDPIFQVPVQKKVGVSGAENEVNIDKWFYWTPESLEMIQSKYTFSQNMTFVEESTPSLISMLESR